MLFKTARAHIKGLVKDEGLERFQAAIKEAKLASRMERIALDPVNHFYLDNWAVSSYEKFGLNENADGFEHEELQKSYRTFTGSWVCLDHNNWHESLAVGTNIDAVYTPDQYVRIIMAVNRSRAEGRHSGLEQKIASGRITDTSMGCWARESVCNIVKCGNIATDESQFCNHIREKRGQTLCNADTNWEPIKVGELNRGVIFFEDSIITDAEGADRNAKIIAKIAMRQTGPISVPVEALYRELRAMLTNATREEAVIIAQLAERVERMI